MNAASKSPSTPEKSPSSTTTPTPTLPPAGEAGVASAAGNPEQAAAGADELNALRAQAARAQEHWEQLLRATADLDNYKKRAARERQEAIKYANESLLQKLIPILDTFDMAMAAATTTKDSATQSLQTGVSMILAQFRSALTEAGLEEIDATGKAFDPNFHEAVSHQESADAPEGHVLQQLRRGYRLRDRLLRPATVIVAKKPEATSA